MLKKVYYFFCVLILTGVACKKSSGDGSGNVNPPSPTVTETGLITVSPNFPSDSQELTITYDPSRGNSTLAGFTGDIFVHCGVITDKSSSTSEWRYVKSSVFNAPVSATKMTSLNNGKYKLTLTPRTFFNVPADEQILQVVMVFRNADGTLVGRNSDGTDIYQPVYDTSALQVKFISPETEPMYFPKPVINAQVVGAQIVVKAVANRAANLTLSLNDKSFTTANNVTTITGTATISSNGLQRLKISANANGVIVEKSMEFIINGTPVIQELPASATKDGVNVINNGSSVILNLYAPNKQSVFVLGDFNDWKLGANYEMKRTPDGNRWWVQIDNLNPQLEYAYQYLIDGNLRLADPYTEKILDPDNDKFISNVIYPNLKPYPIGKTTGLVSVFQTNPTNYNWQISNFNRPAKKDLVIYELLIRDFVEQKSYDAAIARLPYLEALGINAIELMPVNEFEGNSSWGYNTSFHFAPDKYYGTKDKLKKFIDECHKRGIAVILDIVLNHAFGQSAMVQMYFDKSSAKPTSNNPWFNQSDKHPFGVGYDFNHESQATKTYFRNVVKHWIQEYKIDGFRFDLSKGFTQKQTSDVTAWSNYDASRIAIWKDYNSYLKTLDPSLYIILEHFGADSEEKELAAEGMMFWNNVNHNFMEASMGWLPESNFQRIFYTQHSGFSNTEKDKLITYMESHDEERVMYKNLQFGNVSGSYNIKSLATALKRKEMSAAFMLASPGPKMLWQFGELGYDYSINHCVDGTVSNDCRLSEKPIRWDYENNSERKALFNAYAKMIKLKISQPVFETTNFTYNLSGAIKHIILNGSGVNVVVVGNFDVVSRAANITFPSSGTWYDYMNSGQSINVSGSYTATLAPGEYHIYTSTNLN